MTPVEELGNDTIARELRQARPQIPEHFAAELDRRVREGFPKPPSASPLERLRAQLAGARPVRLLAPAGAVATLAVVVSVAVIQSGGVDGGPRDAALQDGTNPPAETDLSTRGEGRPGSPDAGGLQSEEAASAAKVSPSVTRDLAAPGHGGELFPAPPVPGPSDRLAPGRRNRAIEHSASLELSTEAEEFPDVTDGVIGVADRYRGFVVSSQESSSGDVARATFELAIPSQRLQQALADLSSLAHVEARTEDSLDITAPTVSARARLSDARAEVASLRRQLAEADSADETQEIRSRLGIARSQSAAAKAEAQRLARRARYATLSVTVTADGSGDGEWGAEEALDDIGGAFSTAAGVALVTLAVVLPFGLLAAAVVFASRFLTRSRRERALDREEPGDYSA